MSPWATCKRAGRDRLPWAAFPGVLVALLLILSEGTRAAEPASASGPAAVCRSLNASARVRFSGTSTLHDFEGQLAAQPFQLVLSNGTWSARGRVRAADMGTANTKRDRRMLEMLEAAVFPELRGDLPPTPIPATPESTATLHFRIRDQVQPVPVRITQWQEDDRGVRFTATWDLSLKAFCLNPPSVAGIIRVGDAVHVEAQVTALPAPGSPTSP